MRKAQYGDKKNIVDILTRAFDDNKSVNYIIRQDGKRLKRLRGLMDYSFEICMLFGAVFITDDNNGCALVLFPDQKKTNFKSILFDVKLALNVIGLPNVLKAIKREAAIKKVQPAGRLYYLWFIGIDPDQQGKGTGSRLLQGILQHANSLQRSVTLETSTIKNLPWYYKHGFKIYKELDFGYTLYCMNL